MHLFVGVAMKRGPYPTSTTSTQAVHLLGGVQRVRGFAPWSPEKATLALLDQVQGILDEYAAHLPLTIRQKPYSKRTVIQVAAINRDFMSTRVSALAATQFEIRRPGDIR